MIITAVMSNLRLAAAPGNVALDSAAAGLTKQSIVNVSQPLVVDRRRLVEAIGGLDAAAMQRVDDGLRLVLAL